jgi:two-component system, OmpR family, response regulator
MQSVYSAHLFARMTVHPVKMLLVEDSSVLSRHLAETISELPEIELLNVLDSEATAIAELRKRRVDVLVVDLQLKEGSGFGILRAVSAMQRKPFVIVLTNHVSTAHEQEAMALGAQYFLDKARDFQRLPDILRELVISGESA